MPLAVKCQGLLPNVPTLGQELLNAYPSIGGPSEENQGPSSHCQAGVQEVASLNPLEAC